MQPPTRGPNPRSTKISKGILDDRRKIKGWDDATLAANADVSVKTIERGRAGVPISIAAAASIARILDVALETLITGHDPRDNMPGREHRWYHVRMRLSKPVKAMQDQSARDKFVALLRTMIQSSDDITMLKPDDKSTEIAINITDADILRLLACMMDGKLTYLDITTLCIPDHSWILKALALLEWSKGTLATVDSEAWGELLNVGAMNFLKIKSDTCFFCAAKPRID